MLLIQRKLVANIQAIGQKVKMASKKKTAYQKKIKSVMGEYGRGTLHSGKGGPVVKSKKQAIAIAISSASKVKKRSKK